MKAAWLQWGEGGLTLSDCRVSLLSYSRCKVLVDFPCDPFLSLRSLNSLLCPNSLGFQVPGELNLGLLTVIRVLPMNPLCREILLVSCSVSFAFIACSYLEVSTTSFLAFSVSELSYAGLRLMYATTDRCDRSECKAVVPCDCCATGCMHAVSPLCRQKR